MTFSNLTLTRRLRHLPRISRGVVGEGVVRMVDKTQMHLMGSLPRPHLTSTVNLPGRIPPSICRPGFKYWPHNLLGT